MKNVVAGFLVFLFAVNLNAQILDPVTFTTSVEKISDTDYNLVVTATIESGWHLYSQDVPEDGPIATAFTFTDDNSKFQLVGKTAEGKGHTIDDPVFQMKIKFFENTATFKQHIRLLTNDKIDIVGEIEFMVCDDTQCLPPTYKDLSFSVQGKAGALLTSTEIENISNEKSVSVEKKSEVKEKVSPKKEKKSKGNKKGLWTIFIIAFFSGFLALLTPCVFPMIPMTVSFFTKQSKSKAAGVRNAVIYGLAIIAIYVFLGLAVSYFFGADALNALATNVWFNLIFFVLLLVFAASFLGAFEITLPSSWGTKIDKQADRGGIIGIFFMALALAIVSFSCTGPIVGTLLVEAASGGNYAGPVIGMFGFSLAIALPFTLFAAFPGWMNSLPKSGGWLNTVKVVLGFLELALAFKFLSNADLVLELHWFEREVFIAIWIAVFGALAFYLFGKIQLPHDSPLTHISVGRLSLGLIVMSFTIYMIPGLWGAPLNLISAFPPPQHYAESPYGVGYARQGGDGATIAKIPEGAHLLAPHDILTFDDYETGLAYAKKVNKPVMIDFTGKACVNCRKMEQNVWPKDKVLNILKNDVILISLFVDDKRALEEDEVVESVLNPGKKLRYIGQKWSEMQAVKYGTNAQPYYVLMGHDEENLIDPVGYTPDVDEYFEWLGEGVETFKKNQ
ncbi:MAG: thiol:disulfide interchange protein [Flavobacteriaceae bacterium]|nr:MAG: thiol:disulfide interchange protein [Flavobacteriaceae bacterium]